MSISKYLNLAKEDKITKKEALSIFKKDIKPLVVDRYGLSDKVAIRESWNDWTDSLCKDGCITSKQYNTWSNPF